MAGTPQYIRNLNENLIMDALITQGTMSRADISRRTGLSKPTVSSAVEHLIERNLVKETGRADNAQGRKATLIQFNETAYYVCGVDIGATRIRIALSDLNGQIVAYAVYPPMERNQYVKSNAAIVKSSGEVKVEEEHVTTVPSDVPVLRVLHSYVDQLLQENRLQWSDLRCIGFGIPGVVLPVSGKISRIVDPLADMEQDFSRDALARAFPCDIMLDNDVNLAALGEYRKGAAKDSPLFIFFSIGAGTGAGIMVQGHLLHGLGGLTGEVAEMRMQDGRRLEDVLSADGLMQLAKRHCLNDPLSSDMQPELIFEATRNGEVWAIEIIKEYSQMIAWALRQMSTLLAPELIVLGGGIGGNGDVLLPLLRNAVDEQFPVQPQLICSDLGERAVVTGAVQVALQHTLMKLKQGTLEE
ncbi:ROK family transcriptional regulator [Paenibacillus amylolyticus]|uniref:ROK family transcriptional regulator n=1 Tax=Paenibacillus amylolyticus TaxID=1451 RepID=A0A5M9WQH3_PAEAM|nr:ROK family transcriptional regulator [Paenibacillus amylolyticus]KAA8783876.1 ROK family transcriptional regulator [Paenibacillus amylolyticus]